VPHRRKRLQQQCLTGRIDIDRLRTTLAGLPLPRSVSGCRAVSSASTGLPGFAARRLTLAGQQGDHLSVGRGAPELAHQRLGAPYLIVRATVRRIGKYGKAVINGIDPDSAVNRGPGPRSGVNGQVSGLEGAQNHENA
jgi:hypothetical protein